MTITDTPADPTTEQRSLALTKVLVAMVLVLLVAVGALLIMVSNLFTRLDQVEAVAGSQQLVAQAPSDPTLDIDPKLDDVCRLLGAWAARDKVPLDSLFTNPTVSSCEQSAQEGYQAVTATP